MLVVGIAVATGALVVGGLATLDARERREHGMRRTIEAQLCSASACDIQARVEEG